MVAIYAHTHSQLVKRAVFEYSELCQLEDNVLINQSQCIFNTIAILGNIYKPGSKF